MYMQLFEETSFTVFWVHLFILVFDSRNIGCLIVVYLLLD